MGRKHRLCNRAALLGCCFLAALAAVSTAGAHQTASNKGVSVTLHVTPDDQPNAGSPSTIIVSKVRTSSGRFSRSPSYYLNLERFGDAKIPGEAREGAKPRWELIDRTGRFEWHDHRIHYMAKSVPAVVKDEGERTKVFDWRIPVDVRGSRVVLRGDLFWVPTSGGGLPRGALIAVAALVVGGIAFVEAVRRRRTA